MHVAILCQSFIAASLLVVSHSFSKLLRQPAGPMAFSLWRFVTAGILGILAISAALLYSSSSSSRVSLGPLSGDNRSLLNAGIVALASVFMVVATCIQVDGFVRHGVAAMNIPIACITVIISAVVGCVFFGEDLGIRRVLAIAVLLVGLFLFASSPGS